MPVKVKSQVVGLLTVLRKAPRPFEPSNQALLEAVADYASISLVNARLFRALEQRAHSLQNAVEAARSREQNMEKAFNVIRAQIQDPLSMASSKVSSILIAEKYIEKYLRRDPKSI
jgi:GAF domain-containing protein